MGDKKTIKQRLRNFWQYLKRPTFFIPLIIVWLLLESPLIYGTIMYVITLKKSFLALALSWYSLTALPLPIPVMPISIAIATATERIIHKIGEGKHPKTNK